MLAPRVEVLVVELDRLGRGMLVEAGEEGVGAAGQVEET